MANRAKNAQYAYGITIEAGNYNEVMNTDIKFQFN